MLFFNSLGNSYSILRKYFPPLRNSCFYMLFMYDENKEKRWIMAIAKRVFLFLVVNFLVITVISFLLRIFNIAPYLEEQGIDFKSLLVFCFLWGMGGSLFSLMLSKTSAKSMTGLQMIDPTTKDPNSREVLGMVYDLAKKAGLPEMPEVGVYQSPEVNAFATGPSKKNSLVAISSGLLQRMNEDQVKAVVGHEITHVANGDMVTMTLLQGIINAFVMFLARIFGFFFTRGNDPHESSGYQSLVLVLQSVLMFLGGIVVATFSRGREYRADIGGAKLAGPDKMISALKALKKTVAIQDPSKDAPSIQAFKISNYGGLTQLFASHPSLDNRIERLEKLFNIHPISKNYE